MKILNYIVEGKLGEGGMSCVYLASDPLTTQKVAIKELLPHLAHNQEIRQRFQREAKVMATLNHPNIVKLIRYEENETNMYLVMEYVKGITLDNYIKKVTGPISQPKAEELLGTILDAFDYAHTKGVVHRDIKPSNIIISEDHQIKILDFGIAKITEKDSSIGLTRTGTRMGTILYMSPEQVKGISLDNRSDIYSIGIVFWQMLTGQSPYPENTQSDFDIQLKIVKEPLPKAKTVYPHVSDKLQLVIDKACQKMPDDRYQTCKEFKEGLPKERKKTEKTATPKWLLPAALVIGFALIVTMGLILIPNNLFKKDNSITIVLNGQKYTLDDKTKEVQINPGLKLVTTNDGVQVMKDGDVVSEFDIKGLEKTKLLYNGVAHFIGKGQKQKAIGGGDIIKKSNDGYIIVNQGMVIKSYDKKGVEQKITPEQKRKQEEAERKRLAEEQQKIAEQERLDEQQRIAEAREAEQKRQEEEKESIDEENDDTDGLNNNEENRADNPEKIVQPDFYDLAMKAFESGDYSIAAEDFRKEIELNGNSIAYYNMGVLYYGGYGVSKDMRKSYEYFLEGAKKGVAESQYYVAYMSANGIGTAKSEATAFQFYQKAASQGHILASNNLGRCYETGKGTNENPVKARDCYKKAADKGNLEAINNLANMYRFGKGGKQDDKQAFKLYQKAADAGHACAQNSLGYMYQHGLGVNRDYSNAMKYYKKAANQNYADAMNNIGYLYHNGMGVAKDGKKAQEWFRKAANYGNNIAKKNTK